MQEIVEEKGTNCSRGREDKLLEALPSSCLFPFHFQCPSFIRGMMAGKGKGQLWYFGRRGKQGRARELICICHPVLFTVSACSLFNSGHQNRNTSHISVCHMQFFTSSVPWHILYIWRKDLQNLSCQICKCGGRGEEKCQLEPHGGTGGTKNHFVFPSCSYTEMQIKLLPHLSFHHSLWLNTYSFINTSFAMCSHLSRWLTEAYWIQNHIKISNNLWHTWRELKCNVQ